MKPEIKIFADAEQVAQAAAAEFIQSVTTAIAAKGRCTIALAGGSTPRTLYSLLADEESLRKQLDWSRIHVFWGDERHVRPDHADSNYRMANEAMLAKVPVPAENIHRIRGEEADARQAADEYQDEIRRSLQLQPDQLPRFDLVLLGMGPDGHTASLFPETTALHEMDRLVAATWVEKFKTDRITLTFPVLNNAANVIFLVCGAEKVPVLRTVLGPGSSAAPFPAQLVQPHNGRLLWLLDEAAGQALH